MQAFTVENKTSMHEMGCQQWLHERNLGAYLRPIVDTFKSASYKPQSWLHELEAMERDGDLIVFADSVKKHYRPDGARIEEVFLASAKKKLRRVPLLAKLTAADPNFLICLQEKLQLIALPAGAIVVRKGDAGDKMCQQQLLVVADRKRSLAHHPDSRFPEQVLHPLRTRADFRILW